VFFSFFFFTERLKEDRGSLMSDQSESCRWNYRAVDREHPKKIRNRSDPCRRQPRTEPAIDPQCADISSDFDAGSGVTFSFHWMHLTQKRNDTTRQVSRALRFPISSNTSDINRCLELSAKVNESLPRKRWASIISANIHPDRSEISELHYASNRR